jgi:Thioredoxin-like domain
VYPAPNVESFINENLIPARAHVKENQAAFERFNAQWTPTVLILDPKGTERHRIEGFLPADDFLAQLRLGLAHAARLGGDFAGAEQRYRELSQGTDEVAAESLYWAGVSKYKATNDGSALGDTASAFKERFTGSPWAKKASVWG